MTDFPFRYWYMPSFRNMYMKLLELNNNFPNEWDKTNIVIREFPEHYENIDSLADHFVEHVRIKSRISNEISPLNAWKEIKKKNMNIPDNDREKRELVYYKSKGCNLFNPVYAMYLFKNSEKILDIASGWGDRLIAAYASNSVKQYRGWDTNPELIDVYKRLALECSKHTSKELNWKIECAPFENQDDHFTENGDLNGYFDTVIASPPYEYHEIYDGEQTSTNRYKTRDEWYNKYYFKILELIEKALMKGGKIILYIPSKGKMYYSAKTFFKRKGLSEQTSIDFCQNIINDNKFKKGRLRKGYIWVK